MSQLATTATRTTRAPALRDRHDADRVDHDRTPGRSRLWALIEALAYAGAIVDPSGIMAVERLRRAKEEAERRDQV
ncbi:MAG TPA: hypothetical protein VFW32_07410 [Actinomycetes bacterium]|jgi:hypothetical protein|nr:hypothetical protein [Actinomycetes bacterium]